MLHRATIALLAVSTLALAAPAPIPKDNKLLGSLPPTDLGQHTGKIGVDNVDLSKLRVDPVRIDLHSRQDAGSPVTDPNAMRPSPYSDAPAEHALVEKRIQREKVTPDDIPRYRKKYNVGYDWKSPA